MKPAFIIGNGPSRSIVNLRDLKNIGVVWGCNALYREFNPHYLLIIDKKMAREMVSSKYYENNKVLAKKSGKTDHIPKHENIYCFDNRISSPNNSGVASIYFALRRGFRTIYLIGFDFQSPKDQQQNNVYAGTPCYDRHGTRPPKLPKNVTDKIAFWAEKNSDKVNFIRVINPDICSIPPNKGFKPPHMTHITYEQFFKQFNLTSKKT